MTDRDPNSTPRHPKSTPRSLKFDYQSQNSPSKGEKLTFRGTQLTLTSTPKGQNIDYKMPTIDFQEQETNSQIVKYSNRLKIDSQRPSPVKFISKSAGNLPLFLSIMEKKVKK